MRGAAIILAMLIAALAAAVAATVFADQQRWSRTVELRRDQVQAQALAMAGVQWARQILDDDARRSDDRSPGRAVGARAAADSDGGRRDPRRDRRCAGTPQHQRARLCGGIVAGVHAPRGAFRAARRARRRARRRSADWIDEDGAVRDSGAEDAFYLARAVPHLAANGPMLRVAELSFVKGMTPRASSAVLPSLSALPAGYAGQRQHGAAEVLAAIVEQSRR